MYTESKMLISLDIKILVWWLSAVGQTTGKGRIERGWSAETELQGDHNEKFWCAIAQQDDSGCAFCFLKRRL